MLSPHLDGCRLAGDFVFCVLDLRCVMSLLRGTTSDQARIGVVFVTDAGMMSGEVEEGDVWDVLYA